MFRFPNLRPVAVGFAGHSLTAVPSHVQLAQWDILVCLCGLRQALHWYYLRKSTYPDSDHSSCHNRYAQEGPGATVKL
jgi:hypothetical protein